MKKVTNLIILAGGESRRLWPLQDKAMLPFLGKPLISHKTTSLGKYADNIFIVVGKNETRIRDELKKERGNIKNVKIVVQKRRGQGDAILALKGSVNGDSLIVNANDLYSTDLIENMFNRIKKNRFPILLCAVKTKDYVPGGYFVVKGNKVVEIIEKPGASEMPSSYFRLVVDYVDNIDVLINEIASVKSKSDDVYEKALNGLLSKSGAEFIEYTGKWATIKYPHHVLDASSFFLDSIKSYKAQNVSVHKTAIIEGDVYLDRGVKIYEYAKIKGPAYIGRNTVVGNYALVVDSMIGSNSLIGGYSEVTRSYMGNRVYLHRNYVGDSVFEHDILLGAGTVSANFRFDEGDITTVINGKKVNTLKNKFGASIGSNVKVGVNSSIMPGVKIGANSQVSPHSLVKHDIH